MENELEEYMAKPTEKSVVTETMVSRQMQEVKGMVFMAKQYPRDIYESFQRIMTACERTSLAESAEYQYPRGDQRISGPSIRLAEVLAQNWGNIDFGVVELEQKNGESTAMSYCWDLETNVRQTKIFTVKHERHTKKGVTRLTDPRDIYETVANYGARRLRACILGVIPGDVVDKAILKCRKTLVGNATEPLVDRLQVVTAAFDKEYKVSIEMIENHFGYKITAFTEQDLLKLKRIGSAIRDGMGKREDYFDIRKESKDIQSKAEDDFSKLTKQFEEEEKNEAEQQKLPLDGSE